MMHAGGLGVHAAIVALPIGYLVGWLLCQELNPRAFGWSIPFRPNVSSVLVPAGLGIVGALVAGLRGAPAQNSRFNGAA